MVNFTLKEGCYYKGRWGGAIKVLSLVGEGVTQEVEYISYSTRDDSKQPQRAISRVKDLELIEEITEEQFGGLLLVARGF